MLPANVMSLLLAPRLSEATIAGVRRSALRLTTCSPVVPEAT